MKTLSFAVLLLSAAVLTPVAAQNIETDFASIKTHLEFLGYTCQKKDRPNGALLTCKTKESVPDLTIQSKSGGYLLSFYRTGKEKGKSSTGEVAELMNKLNNDAMAARWYQDKDGDLMMECFSPGPYNKVAFSNLIQTFNDDWKRLVKENDAKLNEFFNI